MPTEPVTRPRPELPVVDHPRRRGRARRHTVGGLLVAAYALAAVAAVAARDVLPMPTWLALHLLLLGAASTAVLVWSRHFAQALLHTRADRERWAGTRLAVLEAGVPAVLAGVAAGVPALTAAGATLVGVAVLGHVASLLRMVRGSRLAGRLAPAVWYYVAAGAALLAGAALGALMGTGSVRDAHTHLAVHAAHVHANLFGWLGLTVLGTLYMLWPAVLRTRMVDDAPAVTRPVLALTGTGLALAVAALLAGLRPLAAAGVAGYGVGVLISLRPFVRTAARRPPHDGPAWALAAATGWLLAAVVVDVVGLVRGAAAAAGALDRLVPMLAVGLAAQALVGALGFLLPVTVGGGPAGNRRLTALLNAGWQPRLAAGNVGVLLVTVTAAGPARTAGWVLVLAGFGSAAVLVAAGLWPARWRGVEPLLAGASLVTVAAVLVAVAATGWPAARSETATAAPAAGTYRTSVSLDEFAVRPGVLTVPAGDRLVLTVRNDGRMTHDLKLDGRTGTGMLAPGQQQTVDLGVVRHAEQAWCTLPGHKQAGMVLQIAVAAAVAGSGGGAMPGMVMPGAAPAASPAPGWRPYDPTLRPAPGGTEHRVTLHATETTLEIAPGVRQQMWTFGGTVPGPVLHGRVGDLFTVRLVNDATMPHSLDFHAEQAAPDVAMRPVPPGGSTVYQFRAEHAGAWLYHCGTEPMLQHVAMGMYGAVLIDPPDLAPVGRSLVFVQSDLYRGPDGGIPTTARLESGDPDYVVFNGYADQYVHAPIAVRAGERIRLWLVDAGPNVDAALHVVGAQFDTVFAEGAYLVRPGNPEHGAAQQLALAPGGGGFVEFTLPAPGRYPVVDHRLADAARGAMGVLLAR